MKREETEYISNDEMLDGTDQGLREVRLAMDGKGENKTVRAFLDEL